MTPAKKAARNKRKTTVKSTTAVAKIPQPHGGALNAGGTPGNPGGGRKPSIVKDLATAKLPRHVETLDGIGAGISYITLIGKCPKCGHEDTSAPLVPQPVKPKDQVMAIGVLAKLADTKELVIASPDAAAFFDCVYRATVERVGEAEAEAIKQRAVALMDAKA